MPTFKSTVIQDDKINATGLSIPADVIEKLGVGKKPKVAISINGYTYRTTVAVYSGEFIVPLAKAHREAAGVTGGDKVNVSIKLDTAPREIKVPNDLAAALRRAGAQEAFDSLSFTYRKEHILAIESAKAPDTRAKRVEKAVAMALSKKPSRRKSEG